MKGLQDLIREKILILDGAMGTMIQSYHLTEEDFRGTRFQQVEGRQLKGNNDLLSLTRPDVILDIHRRYLAAGADIIETNTFSSQRISQADYGLEDISYELAYEGARLARQAVDELADGTCRFVAGAIGPTNKTCSMSPDVSNPAARDLTYDELYFAYEEQIKGLLDGGVDILLVEAIFDTLNAKAALFAIDEIQEERGIRIPTMVSGTITDASGRTLSGQTAEAFLISVSHLDLLSIGFNCALGAKQLVPYLEAIAPQTHFRISAHPNAGLPNAFGQYDETPEQTAEQIKEYLDKGLINIIGGCCGTTPEHIKALADLAKDYKPRKNT